MSSDMFTGILPRQLKHSSPVWYRSLFLQQSEFGKTPCSRPRPPPPPSLFLIRISGPFQVTVLCEKKMIKSSNLLLAYKIRFFFCLTLSPFINSSISCRFQFNKNTGFISYCNHTYRCMQVHVRAKVSIVLCWTTIAYHSEQTFQQSNKLINTL